MPANKHSMGLIKMMTKGEEFPMSWVFPSGKNVAQSPAGGEAGADKALFPTRHGTGSGTKFVFYKPPGPEEGRQGYGHLYWCDQEMASKRGKLDPTIHPYRINLKSVQYVATSATGTGSAETNHRVKFVGKYVSVELQGPADRIEAWLCGFVSVLDSVGMTLHLLEEGGEAMGEMASLAEKDADKFAAPFALTQASKEVNGGSSSGSGSPFKELSSSGEVAGKPLVFRVTNVRLEGTLRKKNTRGFKGLRGWAKRYLVLSDECCSQYVQRGNTRKSQVLFYNSDILAVQGLTKKNGCRFNVLVRNNRKHKRRKCDCAPEAKQPATVSVVHMTSPAKKRRKKARVSTGGDAVVGSGILATPASARKLSVFAMTGTTGAPTQQAMARQAMAAAAVEEEMGGFTPFTGEEVSKEAAAKSGLCKACSGSVLLEFRCEYEADKVDWVHYLEKAASDSKQQATTDAEGGLRLTSNGGVSEVLSPGAGGRGPSKEEEEWARWEGRQLEFKHEREWREFLLETMGVDQPEAFSLSHSRPVLAGAADLSLQAAKESLQAACFADAPRPPAQHQKGPLAQTPVHAEHIRDALDHGQVIWISLPKNAGKRPVMTYRIYSNRNLNAMETEFRIACPPGTASHGRFLQTIKAFEKREARRHKQVVVACCNSMETEKAKESLLFVCLFKFLKRPEDVNRRTVPGCVMVWGAPTVSANEAETFDFHVDEEGVRATLSSLGKWLRGNEVGGGGQWLDLELQSREEEDGLTGGASSGSDHVDLAHVDDGFLHTQRAAQLPPYQDLYRATFGLGKQSNKAAGGGGRQRSATSPAAANIGQKKDRKRKQDGSDGDDAQMRQRDVQASAGARMRGMTAAALHDPRCGCDVDLTVRFVAPAAAPGNPASSPARSIQALEPVEIAGAIDAALGCGQAVFFCLDKHRRFQHSVQSVEDATPLQELWDEWKFPFSELPKHSQQAFSRALPAWMHGERIRYQVFIKHLSDHYPSAPALALFRIMRQPEDLIRPPSFAEILIAWLPASSASSAKDVNVAVHADRLAAWLELQHVKTKFTRQLLARGPGDLPTYEDAHRLCFFSRPGLGNNSLLKSAIKDNKNKMQRQQRRDFKKAQDKSRAADKEQAYPSKSVGRGHMVTNSMESLPDPEQNKEAFARARLQIAMDKAREMTEKERGVGEDCMRQIIALATENLADSSANIVLDCFENQELNDMIEANIGWIAGEEEGDEGDEGDEGRPSLPSNGQSTKSIGGDSGDSGINNPSVGTAASPTAGMLLGADKAGKQQSSAGGQTTNGFSRVGRVQTLRGTLRNPLLIQTLSRRQAKQMMKTQVGVAPQAAQVVTQAVKGNTVKLSPSEVASNSPTPPFPTRVLFTSPTSPASTSSQNSLGSNPSSIRSTGGNGGKWAGLTPAPTATPPATYNSSKTEKTGNATSAANISLHASPGRRGTHDPKLVAWGQNVLGKALRAVHSQQSDAQRGVGSQCIKAAIKAAVAEIRLLQKKGGAATAHWPDFGGDRPHLAFLQLYEAQQLNGVVEANISWINPGASKRKQQQQGQAGARRELAMKPSSPKHNVSVPVPPKPSGSFTQQMTGIQQSSAQISSSSPPTHFLYKPGGSSENDGRASNSSQNSKHRNAASMKLTRPVPKRKPPTLNRKQADLMQLASTLGVSTSQHSRNHSTSKSNTKSAAAAAKRYMYTKPPPVPAAKQQSPPPAAW